MLGSLRLPFLFQDLDVEGEKTSLKILKGIGRFDGSEGLSQDTITHVMFNDGLRSRLQTEHSEEAEVALIRDALVEEMKLRAEDEANKAKVLEEEVRKRDADIAALADQNRAIEEENAQTKKAKEAAEAAARLALASQGAELGGVKTRLQAMEEAELRRSEKEQEVRDAREMKAALCTYLVFLFAVIALSVAGAWQAAKLLPWPAKIFGSIPTSGLIAIITFLLGHRLIEFSMCRKLATLNVWPFRQVQRFSRFLWAIVVLSFVVGVGGNIYANWIQKNIDDEKSSQPAAEAKVPEPPVLK